MRGDLFHDGFEPFGAGAHAGIFGSDAANGDESALFTGSMDIGGVVGVFSFANFADDEEIGLGIALPHGGRSHDAGVQEHAAHARFAVADGAQSAAQVQLLADERDGVFGGGIS